MSTIFIEPAAPDRPKLVVRVEPTVNPDQVALTGAVVNFEEIPIYFDPRRLADVPFAPDPPP